MLRSTTISKAFRLTVMSPGCSNFIPTSGRTSPCIATPGPWLWQKEITEIWCLTQDLLFRMEMYRPSPEDQRIRDFVLDAEDEVFERICFIADFRDDLE